MELQVLRIYGMVIAAGLAVVETEWQWVLGCMRLMESWVARGLCQVRPHPPGRPNRLDMPTRVVRSSMLMPLRCVQLVCLWSGMDLPQTPLRPLLLPQRPILRVLVDACSPHPRCPPGPRGSSPHPTPHTLSPPPHRHSCRC